MTNSYKLRPRPNLFDLAIMEGVLNGGGTKPAVEREAYWADPQAEDMEIVFFHDKLSFSDDLDE